MKKLFGFAFLLAFALSNAQTVCTSGFAGTYPCNNIDLQARVAFPSMGGTLGTEGNDCWGWTDPLTGKEYAIMGCDLYTAFVDISNPTAPIYVGKVISHNNISSDWRDIKVYNNHAFIVSEAPGHGMQVFDLTRLRNVTTPQIFAPDTRYSGFGNCHNIAINESSGYAYCIGTNTFGGGPHIVNIQNPLNPVAAGGYALEGYTHDAQIVNYSGPDGDHTGKEVFFGANEDKVVVLDVTNKGSISLISTFTYANTSYTHQGWLTPDSRYWIVGDELDETSFGFNTRSIMIDYSNLDAPALKGQYLGATPAIDHNGYTLGNEFYLANYRAGFRLISTANIDSGTMNEIGFFDTYPSSNSAAFNGAWSVYPYFASGNIIVSDINRGLFILKKGNALSVSEQSIDEAFISPNPASDFATINLNQSIENVEVFNILGNKVRSYAPNNPEFTFNTADLARGMYIVKINGKLVKKLMIK
ncbi:MAG: choice-of-anchor B family protein [Flavobacterium sp.]|nr:choice-of-anchor B family protein [Flavobacterium sp.]